MGRPIVDVTGKKFGHLVVLGFAYTERRDTYWNVKCDCGEEVIVSRDRLRKATARTSCGCIKPGAERDSFYDGLDEDMVKALRIALANIRARCNNPNSQAYPNYGGRGIEVCEEWQKSYKSFIADMGPSWKKGLEIDRIDNAGPYSKDNCRWVTRKVNSRNRRSNINLDDTPWGRVTVKEAAELSGIKYTTLMYRLKRGYSGEALFRPTAS